MLTLNPNDTFPYHSSAEESPFAKKRMVSQHSIAISAGGPIMYTEEAAQVSEGRFSPQMKDMCQQSSLRLLDNFKWKQTKEANLNADTKEF
jgi:hypothetical protein